MYGRTQINTGKHGGTEDTKFPCGLLCELRVSVFQKPLFFKSCEVRGKPYRLAMFLREHHSVFLDWGTIDSYQSRRLIFYWEITALS